MNSGALRALEFDRIVDAVRSFALTPTGASALAGIRPDTDARRVQEALQATTETARYLADQPLFPLRAPDDLEEGQGQLPEADLDHGARCLVHRRDCGGPASDCGAERGHGSRESRAGGDP